MFGLSPNTADRLTESEWADRFHPEDLATVREALMAGRVHGAPYDAEAQSRLLSVTGSLGLQLIAFLLYLDTSRKDTI